MVDDYVLKELKREMSGLIEDVEEIGVVDVDMSRDKLMNRLLKIEMKVDRLIVDCFMGDDDE